MGWGHFEGQNWRIDALDHNPGVLIVNVKAYIGAAWYLILAMLYEVCATIFTAKNIKLSNDRVGLTRSAIFLVFFIVIHAVGNLHVFKGPDDFNGYGYFYVRLYWTGFGLPANIVEEYVALSALLHVFVGLKRTWDKKKLLDKKSKKLWSESKKAWVSTVLDTYKLGVTGILLLAFMLI